MTEWTARPDKRSPNLMRCGVRNPITLRYACQGVMGRIAGPGHVALEPGLTEDPPGHWRPTMKAVRKAAAGQKLVGNAGRATVGRSRPEGSASRPVAFMTTVPLPITRDCPVCGRRGRIDSPAIVVADE